MIRSKVRSPSVRGLPPGPLAVAAHEQRLQDAPPPDTLRELGERLLVERRAGVELLVGLDVGDSHIAKRAIVLGLICQSSPFLVASAELLRQRG